MKMLKIILLIELLFMIFLFGGVLGVKTAKDYKQDELTKTYIELDSEREKSYQLQLENNRLNTILDNYTIQERRMQK